MGTQNQLVQLLSMIWGDVQAGADILIDEHIVEYHQIRNRMVPRVVLKHGGLRAIKFHNYMWWMY